MAFRKRKRSAHSLDIEHGKEDTGPSKRQEGGMRAGIGTSTSVVSSGSALVDPASQSGGEKQKQEERPLDQQDEEEDAHAAKHQELGTGLEISGQDQSISASGNESARSQGEHALLNAEYPDLSGLPPRFKDLVWHQPMDELPLAQPISSHPASTLPASTQRTSSQPASAPPQQAASQPASAQQLIDQQLIDQQLMAQQQQLMAQQQQLMAQQQQLMAQQQQLMAQQQQIIAQQLIAWRPTPQDEPHGRGRDYRFVPPRHSLDDLSLQMALCHTRCEIKELVRPLDLELNATLGTSYWDQWQEIVQSYLYHWPLVSKGKEPPPVLLMAPFYKDHSNWRLPKGY